MEEQANLINQPRRGGYRPGAGRPPGSKTGEPDPKVEARKLKRMQAIVEERAIEQAVAVQLDKIMPLAIIARGYTPKAIAAYVACLDDKSAGHGDKIRAATELLNRGWGRAVETVNVNTINSFAGLSDDELRLAIASLNRAAEISERSAKHIDGTFSEEITDSVGGVSGVQTGEASSPDAEPAGSGSE